MAETTDILVDPLTGDLECRGGDFLVGDSTYQHQAHLLEGQEGDYKQFPMTGVGLHLFLNDEEPTDMVRKIRSQFTRDGMRIDEINAGTVLRIRAQYK